jgi:hypothetical protein
MKKLIHLVALASILTLLIPYQALAADPCQTLLPEGVWEGSTHADLTAIQKLANGVVILDMHIHETGTLSLAIGCTVSGGDFVMQSSRTMKRPIINWEISCDANTHFTLPSGNVVVGANGKPRIDVRWGHNVYAGVGTCPDTAFPPATFQFHTSGPPQNRTISGDYDIVYDDPNRSDLDEMAQIYRDAGMEVTFTRGYSLTRKPQPQVEGLSALLRQYFLRGIPVTNRYTAGIDWDGADPGSARFILEGEPPQDMTVSGNTATYDLALGSIQRTGDIPISIEADIEGRTDRVDDLGPLTLVPLPNWAGPFAFKAKPPTGDHVLYKGEYRLPDQPLAANITLPGWLPYVGGTWGLLPTQLKVGLSANSSGATERDGLAAQGGFGLGNRLFTLAASGNLYGTLQHDALVFQTDPLTLSTYGILWQDRWGLISLIPGAQSLFGIPVLGDLLRSIDNTAGITADIHGGMTGTGRLGVIGDKVALTEGRFDATLGAQATANLSLLVAYLYLTGGGDGYLAMQIVPTVKATRCEVRLYFQARAGAFGYSTTLIDARHTFVACTAASGQTFLYPLASPSPAPSLRYGGPPLAEAERTLQQMTTTNGLTETILAENASLQAQPQLALGPNGRRAFVWNSTGNAGAADVISLRLFDGATWGNAIVLSQANRPAFNPAAVFVASGNLLVAWTEAQLPPDPNQLTEAFVRSFEIAWAEIAPSTGTVIRRGQMAADNSMDFGPRLAAAPDGSVWLAWQTSPGLSLTGTVASPNRLQAASWSGVGWAAAETVTPNLAGVLFWRMVVAGANRVWLVADQDTDGNLGTVNDREIFVYKRTASGWAAAQRLTNDALPDTAPLLALTPAGLPILAWSHDDAAVLGLIGDPATTTPQVWFDQGTNIGPSLGTGELLAGADGKLSLIWPENSEMGQDVWLARFNPASQTWSQPIPLFQGAEQRSSLSARLLSGGDILLAATVAQVGQQTVTFDGGAQVSVPAVAETARLTLAAIPASHTPAPLHPLVFLPRLTSR